MQSHQIRYRNLSPLWWFQGFDSAKSKKALCRPRGLVCQGSNPVNPNRYRNLSPSWWFQRFDPAKFQRQGSNPVNQSHPNRYRNLSPLWWFQGFDPAQRGKACNQCKKLPSGRRHCLMVMESLKSTPKGQGFDPAIKQLLVTVNNNILQPPQYPRYHRLSESGFEPNQYKSS